MHYVHLYMLLFHLNTLLARLEFGSIILMSHWGFIFVLTVA